MDTREGSFVLGGLLTIGLGVALGIGLWWAGAGFDFFPAWFAAGIAVGLGAFFLHVGREERRDRRSAGPPAGPPDPSTGGTRSRGP